MTFVRRAMPRSIAVGLVAVSVAACSVAGPAVPVPTTGSAPVSAVPTTSTVGSASAGPTASRVAPSPADVSFDSEAYRYRARIPGDLLAGVMVAATDAWDGDAQIDSTGPLTDHANLADQRLVFAYGAPTTLDLEGFAAASQAQKAAWHGCPAVAETSTQTTFGGSAAILASFTCGGLHILSLYAVRDGFGLVVNLMSPPGHEADDAAVLERLLAGWSWST